MRVEQHQKATVGRRVLHLEVWDCVDMEVPHCGTSDYCRRYADQMYIHTCIYTCIYANILEFVNTVHAISIKYDSILLRLQSNDVYYIQYNDQYLARWSQPVLKKSRELIRCCSSVFAVEYCNSERQERNPLV